MAMTLTFCDFKSRLSRHESPNLANELLVLRQLSQTKNGSRVRALGSS